MSREERDGIGERHPSHSSISYEGPLPPPSHLRAYEDVLPGLADRIVTMAETEQRLRDRDNFLILHNDRIRIVGSLVVSLALVGAGVYCGLIGEPWLGGVLGTSGAVAGILRVALRRRGPEDR